MKPMPANSCAGRVGPSAWLSKERAIWTVGGDNGGGCGRVEGLATAGEEGESPAGMTGADGLVGD